MAVSSTKLWLTHIDRHPEIYLLVLESSDVLSGPLAQEAVTVTDSCFLGSRSTTRGHQSMLC